MGFLAWAHSLSRGICPVYRNVVALVGRVSGIHCVTQRKVMPDCGGDDVEGKLNGVSCSWEQGWVRNCGVCMDPVYAHKYRQF